MEIEFRDNMLFVAGKIDSTNADEFEKTVDSLSLGDDVVVNASELKYISSAGLRVFLKIKKMCKNLTILDVSQEVYEIFKVTGFSEIMDVKKALRFVSIKNKPVIGCGGHGKVLRLGDDSILKVFTDDSTVESLEMTKKYATNALIAGLKTPISFDVVKTEGGLGLIFELAGAKSISEAICANPDKLSEYAVMFANLLKETNSIEADTKLFPNIKSSYEKRIDNAQKTGAYTDEEIDILRCLLHAIPDRKTFIHGDYHTNNVMIQKNGDLILIDIDNISYGNPIFDIGGMFTSMYFPAKFSPEVLARIIGLSPEASMKVVNIVLSTYYGTTDKNELERIGKICGAFGAFRMACTVGAGTVETSKPETQHGIAEKMRKQLFPYKDTFLQMFSTL